MLLIPCCWAAPANPALPPRRPRPANPALVVVTYPSALAKADANLPPPYARVVALERAAASPATITPSLCFAPCANKPMPGRSGKWDRIGTGQDRDRILFFCSSAHSDPASCHYGSSCSCRSSKGSPSCYPPRQSPSTDLHGGSGPLLLPPRAGGVFRVCGGARRGLSAGRRAIRLLSDARPFPGRWRTGRRFSQTPATRSSAPASAPVRDAHLVSGPRWFTAEARPEGLADQSPGCSEHRERRPGFASPRERRPERLKGRPIFTVSLLAFGLYSLRDGSAFLAARDSFSLSGLDCLLAGIPGLRSPRSLQPGLCPVSPSGLALPEQATRQTSCSGRPPFPRSQGRSFILMSAERAVPL
jgi:hypothetical protein